MTLVINSDNAARATSHMKQNALTTTARKLSKAEPTWSSIDRRLTEFD